MSSVVSEKLILFERIAGGYQIGPAIFTASLGLNYIYMLWQYQGTRISCTGLETGCEPVEQDAQAHPVLGELGVYAHAEGSTSSRQDTIDLNALREYRARVKELENMDFLEPQEEGELNFLRYELSKNTFQGQSKGFTDDKEKCMRRVTKAITRAITGLIEHPDTGVMLIGLDFKDNVIKGYECRYVGDKKLGS